MSPVAPELAATKRLAGAGGIRRLSARWVVTCDLVLETAAHLGGGEQLAVDMALLRDSVDGRRPLLPGASLAGALRHHLTAVLVGYGQKEPSEVVALFGPARGDPEVGSQSALIVHESLAAEESVKVEVRDGVAIDARTGTAKPGEKFDYEVLGPGTTFPLRVELLVPAAGNEAELLSLLEAALRGLAPGDIAIGARGARGLGDARSERWRAVRFDLNTDQGWRDWLRSDPCGRLPEGQDGDRTESGEDSAAAVVSAAWLDRNVPVGDPNIALDVKPDPKRSLVIVSLDVPGELLIGTPGELAARVPDRVHLTSGNERVASGTSAAGALRTHAHKVAHDVRGRVPEVLQGQRDNDCERWVERLFGRRSPKGGRAAGAMTASKVRVSERVIKHSAWTRVTRVALDRLTQGPVDGALVTEQTSEGGTLELRLELRCADKADVGLVLLIVKDLLDGLVPLGGTTGVGRGVVRGRFAEVRLPASDAEFVHDSRFDLYPTIAAPGGSLPTAADADRIARANEWADDCLKAFAAASALPPRASSQEQRDG